MDDCELRIADCGMRIVQLEALRFKPPRPESAIRNSHFRY
jgi:hypothetical protein